MACTREPGFRLSNMPVLDEMECRQGARRMLPNPPVVSGETEESRGHALAGRAKHAGGAGRCPRALRTGIAVEFNWTATPSGDRPLAG